ncbi:MAG: epoxyqueuosine reductase QueH [Paludibacteraceae bacterium]|nr:epoxyqueuosine reductase QueH [Paludibacteraceae bacterium]
MANKINFQQLLEDLISKLKKEGELPSLLLHSCCAPCSSYVLEYLSQFFSITVFYYNPNIWPDEEFRKRVLEQEEFIQKLPTKHKIGFIAGNYDTERFYAMAKGKEHLREGGERCFDCYRLRLEESAVLAKDKGFDYFCTTLSISPLKNAQKLNEIGEELAQKYGVKYLPSDFKKKNGYLRSTQLSKEYGMYRQDYCGCIYSKVQRDKEKKESQMI